MADTTNFDAGGGGSTFGAPADPTAAIPTWVLWLGLGAAAWFAYAAISPMVSTPAPRRLAAPKKRASGGYYVVYDASDDPDAVNGKQRRHFDTKADAQDWISVKLSPARHPRIVPA